MQATSSHCVLAAGERQAMLLTRQIAFLHHGAMWCGG